MMVRGVRIMVRGMVLHGMVRHINRVNSHG